jgi:hypothetical protein
MTMEIKPDLAGAHYGLGFLLLKRGDSEQGVRHLEAFLAAPPSGGEAARWIEHAKAALAAARNGDTVAAPPSDFAPPNNSAAAEAQP